MALNFQYFAHNKMALYATFIIALFSAFMAGQVYFQWKAEQAQKTPELTYERIADNDTAMISYIKLARETNILKLARCMEQPCNTLPYILNRVKRAENTFEASKALGKTYHRTQEKLRAQMREEEMNGKMYETDSILHIHNMDASKLIPQEELAITMDHENEMEWLLLELENCHNGVCPTIRKHANAVYCLSQLLCFMGLEPSCMGIADGHFWQVHNTYSVKWDVIQHDSRANCAAVFKDENVMTSPELAKTLAVYLSKKRPPFLEADIPNKLPGFNDTVPLRLSDTPFNN